MSRAMLSGNGTRKSGWRSFTGGNSARKRAAPKKELLTGVEVFVAEVPLKSPATAQEKVLLTGG